MLDVIDGVASVVAGVETFIAAVLALIFTFVYLIGFRWWKTPEGRAVLYLFGSLLAVTFVAMLAVIISPDYWLRGVWWAIGWALVVFSLGNLLRLLWRNFRRDAHDFVVERKPTGENPIIRKHER